MSLRSSEPEFAFYKEDPEGLPYYSDLVKLRPILDDVLTIPDSEYMRFFPHGCCNDSARAIFLVTGLEEIGCHLTYGGFRNEPHALNYDSTRGLFVCLILSVY